MNIVAKCPKCGRQKVMSGDGLSCKACFNKELEAFDSIWGPDYLTSPDSWVIVTPADPPPIFKDDDPCPFLAHPIVDEGLRKIFRNVLQSKDLYPDLS